MAVKKSVEKKILSLTVIGRDRTGVIAAYTNLLFKLGANIEALAEEVRRGQFSMTLQASWPSGHFDEKAIAAAVRKLSAGLKMETTQRVLSSHRRQKMAILVTHESHCLNGLVKAKLPCDAALVVGSHPDLKRDAQKLGLPFVHVEWDDRRKAEQKLGAVLEKHEIDFIVLARFMRILSPHFVWQWKNKILNIHPSLLPAFQGAAAYRQAFEKGVTVTGVTAHIVTPDLDEGPILDQGAFRILPHWTLPQIAEQGRGLEVKVLVSAVRMFLRHRFDIYWGKVHHNGVV